MCDVDYVDHVPTEGQSKAKDNGVRLFHLLFPFDARIGGNRRNAEISADHVRPLLSNGVRAIHLLFGFDTRICGDRRTAEFGADHVRPLLLNGVIALRRHLELEAAHRIEPT